MFSCVGSFFVMATTANRSEIRRAYLVSVIANIGDWGGTSTTYRFEAVMVDASTRQERVVKTIIKEPMTERKISAVADHENLIDAESYDVAEVRIQAQDEHGNILPFYNEPLTIETEGPIEIIGPKTVALQGGMGGAYVKSKRLQPGEKQDAAVCRQELFKIESYVEMALNYLRFEEMSNDLVLERNSLEQLVRQVVKKYAAIFIYNHISIQLEHLDYTVLTDEKWFCFVLEQILSNALKYTKQGSVKISAEETENGLHRRYL